MGKIKFAINALTEFVPVALFIVATEIFSFSFGVKVLIVSALTALLVSYFLEKRIPVFGIFAASTILFFGALTLIFHNPFFIIIKDTLYYFFFAIAISVGLLQKKYVLRFFFGDFFAMTERGWKILSMRWFFFFVLLGIGNEVSRMMFTPPVWALYKLFAVIATWIFGFYQLTLTKKERLPEASSWGLAMKVR